MYYTTWQKIFLTLIKKYSILVLMNLAQAKKLNATKGSDLTYQL